MDEGKKKRKVLPKLPNRFDEVFWVFVSGSGFEPEFRLEIRIRNNHVDIPQTFLLTRNHEKHPLEKGMAIELFNISIYFCNLFS